MFKWFNKQSTIKNAFININQSLQCYILSEVIWLISLFWSYIKIWLPFIHSLLLTSSFTCSISESDKNYSFNFNIAQKGEINLIILQQFCLLFKAGKVSKHSVENVYEYRVGGIKNSSNIFSYFDKYKLYTKKSLSYILWRQIHEDLVNKHHLDILKRLDMIEKARMINKSNIL